ncbi:hypothetical protein CCACVL1_25100 [Corchorus capsularis]|uniref:ubiquitinyl hydrolase 1 n=1 Tax=Corchorus capsularis TaxID=210143 RepID=A0A1R3GLZ4_COCAP|nr:hypothetical protein CCACVL1_25100 [Corchorus capsularis]
MEERAFMDPSLKMRAYPILLFAYITAYYVVHFGKGLSISRGNRAETKMRKFVMEAGWVPKKLDVYIDAPDIIDIRHMRSKGLQPGEELLPKSGPGGEAESSQPVANEEIVTQLVSMGFNQLHCQKAAINTFNAGVEEAMNWLLSHMDDAVSLLPIILRFDNMEFMLQLH